MKGVKRGVRREVAGEETYTLLAATQMLAPSVLIGVSAQAGAFTRPVIEQMSLK